MDQLLLDAFDEFKTNLGLELDELHKPTDDNAAENETGSSDPASEDSASEGSVLGDAHSDDAGSGQDTEEEDDSEGDDDSEEDVASEDLTAENDARVSDVLRQWAEQDKGLRYTDHLFYKIGHTSVGKVICIQQRDVVVVETLDRVAEDLNLEVFLAAVDNDDSSPTPIRQVRYVADSEGRKLVTDIPLNQINLVHTNVPSLWAHNPDCEVVSNVHRPEANAGR